MGISMESMGPKAAPSEAASSSSKPPVPPMPARLAPAPPTSKYGQKPVREIESELPPCFVRVMACGAGNLGKVFKNACRVRSLPRRVWDATQRLREQRDQFEAVEEDDLKMCLDHVDGLIMGKPGQSSHSVIFCDCRDKGMQGWDDPDVLDGSIKYHTNSFFFNRLKLSYLR